PTMTTPARAAANARNAQKSTGPKSEQGKKRSSRNALKHGLTAEELVLPGESADDYDDRLTEWTDYYEPQGPAQRALIERAVAAQWRLERVARVETQRLAARVRHADGQYQRDALDRADALGRRL